VLSLGWLCGRLSFICGRCLVDIVIPAGAGAKFHAMG